MNVLCIRASGVAVRGLGSIALLWALSLGGCASPRTTEDAVEQQMRALGTWEYRATGIGALERGTVEIVTRDGDLIARFQDQWRGQFEAEVRLQGTEMKLITDRFRIVGRIENGQFTGKVRLPVWDVTRKTPRKTASGHFEALRVRSGSDSGRRVRYGCRALLRETSYACSPLRFR